jgi:lysophospholipase L1-like esterase
MSEADSTAVKQGSRRTSKRAVFAVLMLAGVLGFLEAAGAIFYYLILPAQRRQVVQVALGIRDPDLNSVARYRPHPYLNYMGNPDYVTPEGEKIHHEIGIRRTDVELTEKPDGVFRVLAMGGSTTFGLFVPEARNVWPGLVGLALAETFGADVETVNAGIPNFSTFELIGFAALWLPELEPDLVLVHTGFNDAFTVGFPDEGGPDNTTFRHSWSYRPLPSAVRTAMRVSYFLRALGTGWLSRNGYAIGDMTPAMQYPIPTDDEVLQNLEGATGKYFRRNLEALIVLIRRAGAEPVLVNMPINPKFEETDHIYYAAVAEAVKRNNRIMSEVAERYGVTLVDLYSPMRDPEIYIDAAHVAKGGMMQKARIVSDTLRPVVEAMLEESAAVPVPVSSTH